jgi:hypothetical protein
MNGPTNELIVSTRPARPTRFLWVLVLAALAVAVLAGSALAAGNLVKNGSFEKDSDSDGIPNNWSDQGEGGVAPKRVCNKSYVGNCSLKVAIDGASKQIQQVIVMGGNNGDTYKLTFWAKGKQLVNGSENVYFVVNFSGIGFNDELSNPVEAGNSAWTKVSLIATAEQDFNSIGIWLYSGAESGKVWIDKVKLVALP